MKLAIAGIISLAIACILPAPAEAENGLFSLGLGSDQPIEITSKNFKARSIKQGQEAIFEGSVKAKHEDVTLTCQKLVTILEESKGAWPVEKPNENTSGNPGANSNIRTITATGNVKIAQNDSMATAGKVEYDNVNRTITLTESPRLWQGNVMLEAPTIRVYVDERRLEAVDGKWTIPR